LIHYVISGEGTFYCGPNKFTVGAGQIFVIFPGTVIKYQASFTDPWHYAWIGFHGDEAKEIFAQVGISVQRPVFTVHNETAALALLRNMPAEGNAALRHALTFKANLYAFMAILAENTEPNKNSENVYISMAVKYIKAHYNEDITVEHLAAHVGIGRKYLYAIFKKALQLSPKDYILSYRMEQAKEFLLGSRLSVGSIACSVGYPDPLTFSKMFKRKIGLSPTEYRKKYAGDKEK
jgi:AraC-like DNA-binding protein